MSTPEPESTSCLAPMVDVVFKKGVPKHPREACSEYYNEKRKQYRYYCPCCSYKTWFTDNMKKHTVGKKHILSKQVTKQDYDYLEWDKAMFMEDEPALTG